MELQFHQVLITGFNAKVLDPDGDAVPGVYTGLWSGEWGAAQEALSTHPMLLWVAAIVAANVNCSKLVVSYRHHGRGHSYIATPRFEPFLA